MKGPKKFLKLWPKYSQPQKYVNTAYSSRRNKCGCGDSPHVLRRGAWVWKIDPTSRSPPSFVITIEAELLQNGEQNMIIAADKHASACYADRKSRRRLGASASTGRPLLSLPAVLWQNFLQKRDQWQLPTYWYRFRSMRMIGNVFVIVQHKGQPPGPRRSKKCFYTIKCTRKRCYFDYFWF
jgi:hypothetical protein